MSVLKLSKNDIIRKENNEDKIKLKKSDISIDTAKISGWEQSNRASLEIINNYNNRINKSEWLDEEDRKKYRKAIDTYISTANRLRGINKTFGEGYSDEDEQKWTDSIASMNSAYDSTVKYYSQWIDEKDYKGERNGWFQKSNQFDDGYQFGDITKTIVGSTTDLVKNITAGALGIGESALDALVTISPYVGVSDDWAEDFVKKDLFNEEEFTESIFSDTVKALTGIDSETDSVFGKKTDSLTQSAGQLGGTIGLQLAGVPWWLTTGVTSFGGEAENAFNQGATVNEAVFSGLVSAGAEILTEKISNGISFGKGKTLEDLLPKLTSKISNKVVRKLADLGIDMVGEGGEEILSGYMSAIGQKFSYASEKEISELFSSEDALDSFIGGAVLGFGGSVVKTISANKKARKTYGNGADVVSAALDIDSNNAYAQKMQSKLDKGKSLSGGQINRIVDGIKRNVDANESALVSQDKGKIKAAAEAKLTEYGETGDVSKIADAIVKAELGEKLTSAEEKMLNDSTAAFWVAEELDPDSPFKNEAEYSNWAESLGTKRINAEAYNRGIADVSEVSSPQAETLPVSVNALPKANATEAKIKASVTVEDANAAKGKTSSVEELAEERASVVKGWSEEATSAMVKGYDGSIDPDRYATAFDLAYEMGANGAPASKLTRAMNLGVSETVAYTAYELGKKGSEKVESALNSLSNNGIINTNESEAKNENGENIHLRNGGKRDGGKNTERQVSRMEGGSGQAESRGKASRIADSEAARLVNEGREVKVADLGILGGSAEQSVRVVDKESETSSMKEARKRAEARGLKVTFFVGDNLVIKDKNGEWISARAYIKGNHVFVRADHSLYTADQLMRHELGHDMIAKGEVDINAVRERLLETVGKEKIDEVAELYTNAYEGSGMSADEIWEECICDSLGDMNIFAGKENAEKFIGAALSEIKAATNETKSPTQTRGSPEGKASRETGEYSEEDYKNYGWVRHNNVINAGYWRNFTENFAQAVSKLQKYPKTKSGEFMISVYDVYSESEVDDVIVFAKGTIESPDITKIVKFNLTDESDIYPKRRNLYEAERRGVRTEAGEIFDIHYKADFVGGFRKQGNGTESNRNNNGFNANRSRSEIKANPITQFNVNEDENTVTYTYKNGETVTESLGKASRELDTDSTEYKINTSMTMAEAKRMIETAYKVNGIAEYYEDEYKDAEDWLKKAGSDEVEMYIENDYDLQAKYINSNEDILNEEYRISDVLDAYLAGTLIGKEKPKPKRLDVSQSTRLRDDRFYSPQKIEDAKATFELANQKAVGKDANAINKARAEILLFAHNKGAAELLGVTQAELNKKLRTWSRYSATARSISESINAGVAEENRWTGIENSSYINKAKVTNEDIERLVASVEGDSRGYERKYIARVMLAADTHIDYSGLKFKFASSQQVNADNNGSGNSGGRVLGFYDDTNRLIEVTHDKPHTVAHEMGHYIDAQWGRDLVGGSSSHLFLTHGVNADIVRERYGEPGVQFLNNFKLFINSLSDVNQNYNSYYNDRKEIFARFFARFIEWTDNIATGNKYYSYESTMYNDKFTQAQYVEFARLLQEKALLDGTVKESRQHGKASRELDTERVSYVPTFYSHMEKVIDDIKLEKMGTSSILNHLKNRGVKDEEIKWSGIETFLEGKKSVTKAELQEFIAGSQLVIEEDISGINNEAYTELDSLWREYFDNQLEDTFDPEDFDSLKVKAELAVLEDMEYDMPSKEIQERMAKLADSIGKPTRWEQYKLEGGTNYRELVFKLPNSSYSNRAMRGHWGQDAEGVLVHARMQDFNVDGKKMLFIEELQSDWHNEGREKGYSTPEYEDAVAVYNKLADEYGKVRQAFNKYVRSSEFRSDPDEVSKKKFDWLRNKMDTAEKRMQDAERDVEALKKKGMGDVADAPFRDNYHEYVLKRLLRMAAEEGYDSIGWTIADTQSKRWSYDYEKAYQIEYDQEMPKFLRKYGKKWGATVGKSVIEGNGEVTYTSEIGAHFDSIRNWFEFEKEHIYLVYGESLKGKLTVKEDGNFLYIENKETGERYPAKLTVHDGNQEVWSMDITDSMKDSVLYEGQPKYSRELDFIDFINEQAGEESDPNLTKTQKVAKVRGELERMNVGKGEIMAVMKLGDKMFDLYGGESSISDFRYGLFEATKLALNGSETGFEAAYDIIHTLAKEVAYNPKDVGGEAEQLAEIKREIRGTKLSVHEADKTSGEFDIYGGYGEFRKRLFGKVNLVNDGVGVDSKYIELQNLYGESFFPDVNTISEQLMQLEKLMNTPLSEYMTVSDEELEYTADKMVQSLFGKLGDIWDRAIKSGETIVAPVESDKFSNRSLLVGALETAAQNDIEKNKLKQYKEKIDLINSEEQKLLDLRIKIKELSFAKGARDTEAIKNLQFEANQAANRINTYDRQLLNLESTKALKGVLEREKAQVRKREAQKNKETLERYREKAAETRRELMNRYQESRKRATEGRNKTAMRHKIKDVVKDLNKLLNHGTKDRHVKEELKETVASSLALAEMLFSDDIRNEDIVRLGVDSVTEKESKLLNEYSDLLDTIDALYDKREYFYGTEKVREELLAKVGSVEEQIAKVRNRISYLNGQLSDVFERERARINRSTASQLIGNLADEYLKLKDSDTDYIRAAYDEYIYERLDALKKNEDFVGKIAKDMNLAELTEVYDAYKMVEHFVRNANKAFKAQKGETITQMAEAVNGQVRDIAGQPYKHNVIKSFLMKAGWKLLKPFVAFRTIGSVTLTNLYKELRVGEDVFYNDVKAAQAFIEEQYKKHNYKSWDLKKPKEFTAKSGKTFQLTLEQRLSMYAYYKREKAHKHIVEGGIVFENSIVTEKNKLGIPIAYDVTTKDAFNLSEETFAEIANSLTEEQKAFVDAMQEYLSTVMGEKGNEVSMALHGVKLFKEEFYLPIKSSEFYMNFKPEEAGEVRLKSPAFSKETTPHANNPIVLHNFTDLWAEHVNNMSMYHSFVLALEDFTRVYNYKTKTDAKVETMDTKATLETAYPGVTNYINKFLKDMNGGVRSETVGGLDKLVSLSKKGAVLGSWSVAIQQPSAVMRAMAMINPKYFITTAHKSINLLKHKQDWAELKKYAPIAGIKEMGRFDVGMGQGTVDWIQSNKTLMEKGEDFLSAAPAFMDEVTWVTIWNAVKRETANKNPKLNTSSEEFLKLAGERFTDVISMTQVYDSVFSRSDLMRNKSWIAKAVTAFMAEPTTTLNMIWDSWVQAKRTGGFKAYAKATVTTGAPIMASIVLNAALKSIIMAMRDDDEDESYGEKYLESLFGEIKDNLNPLTLIPIAKDIVSIFRGYDVERMDMALISDFKKALDAFDSEEKTLYEKWSGFIGATSAFFGIPAKNVERDIRGLIITIFGESEDSTAMGILNAIEEGWTGEEKSNGQQLYEAMIKGDTEQIKRVEGRFDDQKDIDAAIRKALRENDSRIREAAEAYIGGDYDTYNKLREEIVAEGNFSRELVTDALKAEYNYLKKKAEEDK